MPRLVVWAALIAAAGLPVLFAAFSPYLAYRGAAYIVGGFAGIVGLSVLLIQPLLAAGYLPGLSPAEARVWHRRLGAVLVVLVLLHLGGLYLTSAPDTLDALLLVSPTPFSVWGVISFWGTLATGLLVASRRRLRMRPATWRIAHNALAAVVVIATVAHALQIEGAMEPVSKWLLSLAALAVTALVLIDIRLIRPQRRRVASDP